MDVPLVRFYVITRQVMEARKAGAKNSAPAVVRDGDRLVPRGPDTIASALPVTALPVALDAAWELFGPEFSGIETVPCHALN